MRIFLPLRSAGTLIGVFSEKDLKPLSQKARPRMPLDSELGQQLLADRSGRHLVQVVVIAEDERQVEDLELLDAERAELGQRRRQHLDGAQLQRFHFFLVLVERRIGVNLDLDPALGQFRRLLGEHFRRLAFRRIDGDDVAELDDDRLLGIDGQRQRRRQTGQSAVAKFSCFLLRMVVWRNSWLRLRGSIAKEASAA